MHHQRQSDARGGKQEQPRATPGRHCSAHRGTRRPKQNKLAPQQSRDTLACITDHTSSSSQPESDRDPQLQHRTPYTQRKGA